MLQISMMCIGLLVGNVVNKLVDYYIHKCEMHNAKWNACKKCHAIYSNIMYIPIFFYLYYKGKCPRCKQALTLRYPLCELAFPLVAYFVFQVEYGSAAVVLTLLLWILLSMALIDAYTMYVPLVQLVLFAVIAIILSFIKVNVLSVDRIFAMFLFSIPIAFVASIKKNTIGSADVFYFVIAGYALGLWGIIFSSVIAYVCASIYSIYLMCFKRKQKDCAIAMFPFFFVGFFMYVIFAYEFMKISFI